MTPVERLYRDETEEVLVAVGLRERAAAVAAFLSHGGQKQLELGIALALEPQLLLLDEPTAGMSPEETMQTAAVLRHLNQGGLTIIVVEHDIAFVREVASRVTVLHQGRIFAEGTIDEVTAHEEVRQIYLGRA